jgi:hypothetical protein
MSVYIFTYIHMYIYNRVVLISGSESQVSLCQSLVWELLAQNTRAVEAVRKSFMCIMYLYIHICIHVYKCVSLYIYADTYIYMYIHSFTYICMNMCIYMCTYVYVYICIYITYVKLIIVGS